MRRPGRSHMVAVKTKTAISAQKGDETLAALAEKFDVHPHQITQWKRGCWKKQRTIWRRGVVAPIATSRPLLPLG